MSTVLSSEEVRVVPIAKDKLPMYREYGETRQLQKALCRAVIAIFSATAMLVQSAMASESIVIRKAWATVDTANPKELEIFLEIENNQLNDDYLLAVEISQAAQVFIHELLPGKNHETMSLPALQLPATSRVSMSKWDVHLVALGIKDPRIEKHLSARAIFRDGAPLNFEVPISKPTP